DRDPEILDGNKIVPNIVHLEMAWRMERIHHLGAVGGNIGEVIFFLVLDELEIHRCPPGGSKPFRYYRMFGLAANGPALRRAIRKTRRYSPSIDAESARAYLRSDAS